MSRYLISFPPTEAMTAAAEELPPTIAYDAHRVIAAARAAGVLVASGGIDESFRPFRVDESGHILDDLYADRPVPPHGGYTILSVPNADVARVWAARIAAACRCPQEVRRFQVDPDS